MIKQQICRAIIHGSRVLGVDGLIPDKLYLQLLYRRVFNKKLDLNNPKSFNEKLQWLKLYDRRPEYTKMVDKYAVKEYVAKIIGGQYIIPTIGVWDRPEDIEWDSLPEQFVLKCTHDSGGLVICRDKSKLDKIVAMEKLRKSLKFDYYKAGREWPYKEVPRRIIAERFLKADPKEGELRDYKFFCFNGVVKCFKIDFDRYTAHRANYFTPKGDQMRFGEEICPPNFDKELKIPDDINYMIALAERLSKGISFVRVDFYNTRGDIYFGEMTLFPAGGFGRFMPEEWDEILGSWIKL